MVRAHSQPKALAVAMIRLGQSAGRVTLVPNAARKYEVASSRRAW